MSENTNKQKSTGQALATGPVVVKLSDPDGPSALASTEFSSDFDVPEADDLANFQYNRSDVGNAEFFIDRHGDNLRYVADEQVWLRWDDTRWVRDQVGVVTEMLKESYRVRLNALKLIASSGTRKDWYSWILTSESNLRLKAALDVGRSDPRIVILSRSLDTQEHLLGVPNGVVDLRTGELLPAQRELLMTRQTAVEYVPGAKSAEFASILFDVLNRDQEFVTFFQKLVGYSLQGSTREERIMIIHGPGGTGKTTTMNAITAPLGDYTRAANPATFLSRDRHSSGPSEDLARLAGARFVTAIEVDDGQKLAAGIVKQISGGDLIAARHLYKSTFEFRPELKLWFVVNHVPSVMADDDAMWRRLIRLPFTHKPKVVDRYLKAVLTSKEASVGILAWAVEGCMRWYREGLRIPPVVEASTRALQEEMNPLSEFVTDYFDAESAAAIPIFSVVFLYDRWCQTSGQRFPLNKRAFNRNMETLGFRQELRYVAGKRMRCWIGLRLKDRNRKPTDEVLGGLPLDDLLERPQSSEPKPQAVQEVANPEDKAPGPGGLAENNQTPPRVADDDEAYFRKLVEDDQP